ncbi:ATP-binding cassette domain-containing protein [Rhodococcus sp. HNM0569]|uniref:ATP-binding cassette domain-containing protein n=1 Tax=Rhodococcus sp. HNM0569 TaxID=2716340 RepID=UPI00146A1A44|nr:ATP-binding cassette domain-containing protein [Rhodococcus sp. HNM0569]NLU84395.1 ATP-binding cassette domain-containing protein [Rhodococcus sp. HNM0569]
MVAGLRALTVDIDTGRWAGTVLENVNLEVTSGHVTAVLGGPGDGKTMVARALTGRLPETACVTGEVVVDGRVAYVPQDGIDAFAPDRSVADQLDELAQLYGKGSVEDACRAACYPLDAAELFPRHNSAGQIQRAALAAALATDPDVLVADGPTASLDRGAALWVWRSLRRCADDGAALLVVTHDVPLLVATGFADRVVVLEAGRVLADGPLAEVSAVADPRVQSYFRAC